MTHLRMKLENQSEKIAKGKRRQTKMPREELLLFRNIKTSEIKISKPEKKPQEASSRTKVLGKI